SETLDPAFATLLADLKDRGMLANTLVVWMGEFGRTPVINPNGGRDHFPLAWSPGLAGAGVQGGQAVRRTRQDGAARPEPPSPPPSSPPSASIRPRRTSWTAGPSASSRGARVSGNWSDETALPHAGLVVGGSPDPPTTEALPSAGHGPRGRPHVGDGGRARGERHARGAGRPRVGARRVPAARPRARPHAPADHHRRQGPP